MAENASNEVSLLESIVPHDRKESALRLFAENNYQIKGERMYMILYLLILSFSSQYLLILFILQSYLQQGMLDKVMLEQPNHGMNWSPNSKKSFANTIDRSKDFTKVASTMDKTKGDCQAYYYSSFKCTREYMELKRSTQKKESSSRRSTITTRGSRRCSSSGTSSNNDDSNDDENNRISSPQHDTTPNDVGEPWTGECTKCKGDGELLCCDGCDSMFHLRCAALEHVPSGNWFCEECIAQRGKKRERERKREIGRV